MVLSMLLVVYRRSIHLSTRGVPSKNGGNVGSVIMKWVMRRPNTSGTNSLMIVRFDTKLNVFMTAIVLMCLRQGFLNPSRSPLTKFAMLATSRIASEVTLRPKRTDGGPHSLQGHNLKLICEGWPKIF